MQPSSPNRRQMLALAGGLGWCSTQAQTQTQPALQLYSYHLKPPFLLDDRARQGLWPDLLPLLARQLGRPLRLRYLPRRRAVELLETGQLDGALLGVSPLWFERGERWRWTPPLLDDADLLISHRERPLRLQDLIGQRLALPRGYRVPALQADMAAGRILVAEPDNEPSALAMLVHRRVDAALLTRRTLQSLLRKHPGWQAQLHLDEPALGRFELGLLVPPALEADHGPLSMAVRRLRRDPAWPALLQQHLGSSA